MKKFLLPVILVFIGRLLPASTPTWSQDIAPLLYAHCTTCHHAGSIAPFSLLTYNDAYTHASLMNNDLITGLMPPWPADTSYKHFLHERVLSPAQISLIEQWATGGRPEGDVTLAPSLPAYSNGSQLGTVDFSVVIPTYTVSGTGDVYRNFPIPAGLSQQMYITAIEVVPGNPSIVHHVLVFQDSTNVPAQMDANDPGPGYTDAGGTGSTASVLLNGWAPGTTPYYTPVGTGFRLPANTNIVVQVHYPNGAQGQTDSTRINFKLTPVAQRNITVYPLLNYLATMTNGPINIPANSTKTYYEKYTTNTNLTFLATFPHMHLIGRSIKSWANMPATHDTIPLISIPKWNFHWQGTYVFPNAVKIPSGSALQASAYYDNTSNNPFNPNFPPQTVTAGEATTNEMMLVFFSYLPYQNGDTDIIIDRRIIPQGATTFCPGQSVILQTIIGQRYTYQWYMNGAAISGATGASYAASQAGHYYVNINLGANTAYSDTIAVNLVSGVPTAHVIAGGSTTLCPGQNIILNAGTGTNYTYQWFNDTLPLSGAGASSYTATVAGNYSVQVYNGCYAKSLAVVVSTAAAPSAAVSPSGSTTFCQGNNVTLSAVAGLTYLWNNGSTTQSITVSQAGNYQVTVTNSGNCSAVSGSTTVIVNQTPVATVNNSGATAFCVGQSVNLSTPANLNYSWSNNSTAQTITVTQSGSYTVTVTNTSNCSAASAPVQVTVHALPTATISAGGPTSFCNGSSVSLNAPANTTYHWSNNSSTQSISATQSATYALTVTDANACSNTATITVTVFALPDTTVTANKPTTICPGDSVTLTGASGLSYHWSNGAISQSVNVLTNGTFTLTVTDAHSCSAVSSPVTISVSNSATAGITPSGPTSFCNGGAVTLTASAGASYEWSNGSTAQEITVNAGGSYVVTVTISGSCRAISNPQSVVVYQNPGVPMVTTSGPTTFCAGDSVTLSAATGYNYLWSNGQTTQQLNIATNGNYSLTVSDTHSCTASSQAIAVTVNPLPLVSLILADTSVCSTVTSLTLAGGTPAGGVFNGTAVNGNIFSPAVAGVGSFTIGYTYTDNNGCVNSAAQDVNVKSCLGIEGISLQRIICIPNPNNGNFEIDWTGANAQVSDIAVYDLEGKMIYSEVIGLVQRQTMSLPNVASACYILLLKTDQGPVYMKLVIEK